MNCAIQDFWSFETFCCFFIIVLTLSSWSQNLFDLKIGYGKFAHTSKFMIPSSVAWAIYESPNLIYIAYFLLFKEFPMKISNIILLSMFFMHYFHRAILYPLKLKGVSRKYPLEIASAAILFCIFNGYYQVYSLSTLCKYDDDWIYDFRFCLGIFIFLLGMFINIKSDNILLKLKKKKIEQLLKEDKSLEIESSNKYYVVPNEFLFKFIASPNFLGEVLEWVGYGIAGWSLNGMVFAFTTFNVLLSRALKNYHWYKTNFKDYPKNRKAMIPFII